MSRYSGKKGRQTLPSLCARIDKEEKRGGQNTVRKDQKTPHKYCPAESGLALWEAILPRVVHDHEKRKKK